jgi:conjugative relaxase-like TrwC/TraI family protein
MIFINHMKSARAAKDYYSQHIAPGDGKYYANDPAELKGVWHGRAAGMLGLSGEVTQKDFFTLCDNINPETGKQLTPRMDDDRRVLTDFTFDAPKAVTLAYELGGDERILTAFRQSVRETMAEIEQSVETRVRRKGADEDRTTGNMVWAEHIHRTTRPVDGSPDPQLHAHATILNATYDSTENRWKAIQLGNIVRDKGYYQAAFHARLAGRLHDLGYGIEKHGNSFTLAGISRDTVEQFSRRTAVISVSSSASIFLISIKQMYQFVLRTSLPRTLRSTDKRLALHVSKDVLPLVFHHLSFKRKGLPILIGSPSDASPLIVRDSATSVR